MEDAVGLSLHIMMGLGLAACTGLRAFMPMFVVGLLARAGHVALGPEFQFLTSDPAIVVFGIATLVEIVGDKIPAIDHALDAVGVVVKPVVGTALFASLMTDLTPVQATALGMMGGGGTATVLHLKKTLLRLLSSAGTLGLANPLISASEDVTCGVGIAVSLLLPVLAMIALVLLLAVGFQMRRRLRGRAEAVAG